MPVFCNVFDAHTHPAIWGVSITISLEVETLKIESINLI